MIQISNISFAYRADQKLFDRFDWAIDAGSTVGLVGPNGAGKSTLLRLAAGLLAAQKGDICIGGVEVWPRTRALSSRLFYMSEDFSLPTIALAELGGHFGVFYPKFSNERFDQLMERFELKRGDSIQKLSFGGVKKAMLAFGLATGADILLLDEPTNGLDPSAKEVLAAELASAASEGATTVVATHHLEAVEPLLSHLVVIDAGKIALQASCVEFSNAFRFGQVDPAHAIYSRATLGTHYGIERCDGCDGSLDLNLLYEAVRQKPERFSDFK